MTTFLKIGTKIVGKGGNLLATTTALTETRSIFVDSNFKPLATSTGSILVWDNYYFSVTGRTAGTVATNGTMVFSATEDLTVTGTGDVTIVSNTITDDVTGGAIRRHTVVFSCANEGSGKVVIAGKSKVISLGNHRGTGNPGTNFYAGADLTAPILSWNLDDMPSGLQKIYQLTTHATILPATGTQAMPVGLTYIWLNGNNIAWAYTGALPSGLTFVRLISTSIAWTYTGALPTGLTYLYLLGATINWTGTTFGSLTTPPNMTNMSPLDYRDPSNNMTYAELLLMLDGLINRVGTLPATVTIREQPAANVTAIAAADPIETGTDPEKCKYYINLIKTPTGSGGKGVTTFTLNTTNI